MDTTVFILFLRIHFLVKVVKIDSSINLLIVIVSSRSDDINLPIVMIQGRVCSVTECFIDNTEIVLEENLKI